MDSALDLNLVKKNIWLYPSESSLFIPKKRTASALSAPSKRGRKSGFLSTRNSFRRRRRRLLDFRAFYRGSGRGHDTMAPLLTPGLATSSP